MASRLSLTFHHHIAHVLLVPLDVDACVTHRHQPLLNPLQDPVRCLLGYFCGVCMFGAALTALHCTALPHTPQRAGVAAVISSLWPSTCCSCARGGAYAHALLTN